VEDRIRGGETRGCVKRKGPVKGKIPPLTVPSSAVPGKSLDNVVSLCGEACVASEPVQRRIFNSDSRGELKESSSRRKTTTYRGGGGTKGKKRESAHIERSP